MQEAKLQELVDVYVDAIIQQAECILQGNARKGNKFADRYVAAMEKLLNHGDAGRDALVPLLRHQHDDVRVKTAALLLRYRHHEAVAVLEAAAQQSRGFAALGAEQTLKRWRDGTWNLDGTPGT